MFWTRSSPWMIAPTVPTGNLEWVYERGKEKKKLKISYQDNKSNSLHKVISICLGSWPNGRGSSDLLESQRHRDPPGPSRFPVLDVSVSTTIIRKSNKKNRTKTFRSLPPPGLNYPKFLFLEFRPNSFGREGEWEKFLLSDWIGVRV